MKKLLFIILVAASFAANARINSSYWIMNDVGASVVQSNNNDTAFSLVTACGSDELWFSDTAIPYTDIGKTITAKVRIDLKTIREFTGEFEVIDDIVVLRVEMTKEFLREMKLGDTMRVQWPVQNGQTIVEIYTLKGFTKSQNKASSFCDTPKENDFFKPRNGNEFFASI